MSKRLFLGLVGGIVFMVAGNIMFVIVTWLTGHAALLADYTSYAGTLLPICFGLGFFAGVTLDD